MYMEDIWETWLLEIFYINTPYRDFAYQSDFADSKIRCVLVFGVTFANVLHVYRWIESSGCGVRFVHLKKLQDKPRRNFCELRSLIDDSNRKCDSVNENDSGFETLNCTGEVKMAIVPVSWDQPDFWSRRLVSQRSLASFVLTGVEFIRVEKAGTLDREWTSTVFHRSYL